MANPGTDPAASAAANSGANAAASPEAPREPDPARNAAAARASLPDRVRCYICGRRADPRVEACPGCGAVFLGLCACGAQHSLYATACGACGARHAPRRLPRGKHPFVRAVRWGLVAAVAAAGVWLWIGRGGEEQPWAIKFRASQAFRDGRYRDAVDDYRRLTVLTPRDAEVWHDLAASYRKLGMGPEVILESARAAVERAPRSYATRMLAATVARDAGQPAEALLHARAAAELDTDRPEPLEMAARILLEGPEPDVHGAVAALDTALRRPNVSVEARVLHAECLLLVYGSLRPESYPPEVAAALDAARLALASIPVQEPRAGESLLRVRILLACGEPQTAWGVATTALEALAETAEPDVLAALHVAAGRGLIEWRDDRDGARTSFLTALRLSPTAGTCRSIVTPLSARGADPFAAEVLAAAVSRSDPEGAVGTCLAELLLRLGRAKEAAAAAEAALQRAPASAAAHLVHGDALFVLGDRAGARALFERTAELDPSSLLPRLRLAMLSLAEPEGPARAAAVSAARETLRKLAAEHPRDSRLRVALARLDLAAGDPAAAAESAREATTLAPADVDAWRALADAHLATGSGESLQRAAIALQRLRSLRPGLASVAMEEAATLLRGGDALGAVAAASRHLEKSKDDVALLDLRARAQMQLRHWVAAAADLARIREATRATPDVLLASAECAFRTGDRAAALRFVEDASAQSGSDLRPVLELLRHVYRGEDLAKTVEGLRATGATALAARVLLVSGDLMGAEATARERLAAAPDDPEAIETIVLAAMDARGADPRARAECEALVARLPGSVPAVTRALLRCRILLAAGDDQAAWSEIEPYRRSVPRTSLATFVHGLAAFESGRTVDGLALLRQALVLPGATPPMPTQVAGRLAAAASRERELLRREALLREASGIDPTHPQAAAQFAEVLFLRGDPVTGAKVAEEALASRRAKPDEAIALRFRAAGCRIVAGQADAAETHVRALASLAPDSPFLPLLRGHTALSARRFDDAEREFTAAAQANPEDPWAAHGSILTAIFRRDRTAALRRLDEWIASHPGDTLVALAIARAFAESADPAASVEVLARAAKASRGSYAVTAALVRALLEADRPADAVAAARELSATVAAGDPAAQALLAEALVATPAGAAEALALSRQVAAAEQPDWRRQGALVGARALLFLDRAEEALRGAEEVLEAKPAPSAWQEAYARDVAGLAAVKLERWPVAVRHLRREAELRPRDARVLNNAAWAMAQLRDSAKQGLALARKAVEMRPGNPSFRATQAACAHAAGELEEASAACLEGLRRHEGAPEADPAGRARLALRLAQVLLDRGRPTDAREVARSVAGFRPAPPKELADQAAQMASR